MAFPTQVNDQSTDKETAPLNEQIDKAQPIIVNGAVIDAVDTPVNGQITDSVTQSSSSSLFVRIRAWFK